ncbi:AMED_5909 family protein [Saccharothrix obliqua]|uniref:AMED_5909 family protein n=1 Tax=Saccharothrix obliqua TaxID=2861747 RepID=UPI0027E224BE|nr:AMED_5909 family protein [Saccharothrix obliqua]
MYERIADVDRGHHHEALCWAARERAMGKQVVPRSPKGRGVSVVRIGNDAVRAPRRAGPGEAVTGGER